MNSIYTCKTFSIVLADIDHIEHSPVTKTDEACAGMMKEKEVKE